MKETRRREEPRAWARKYLMAASPSFFVWERRIKGISERRFSSKEAQIIKRLLAERANRGLVRRRRVKRVEWGRGLIMVFAGFYDSCYASSGFGGIMVLRGKAAIPFQVGGVVGHCDGGPLSSECFSEDEDKKEESYK